MNLVGGEEDTTQSIKVMKLIEKRDKMSDRPALDDRVE